VAALAGCGGSSADRLVEEEITLLNEMADAYESDAPQATINEIGLRIKEIHKQLDDLKLTQAAKKRIMADHQDGLKRVNDRLAEAERKHEQRK
jgi:hypothetical protein